MLNLMDYTKLGVLIAYDKDGMVDCIISILPIEDGHRIELINALLDFEPRDSEDRDLFIQCIELLLDHKLNEAHSLFFDSINIWNFTCPVICHSLSNNDPYRIFLTDEPLLKLKESMRKEKLAAFK